MIVQKQIVIVTTIFTFLDGMLLHFKPYLSEFSAVLNPLPCMPILDSSNSAANKDMMSKIWTNGGTII